ncbi:MAG TPA: DcaP family trimeric outer membrane transporter [Verrucomicrobiota bacterium]|nr:DcaP family trimeric outer membrane transporter [Verrucomicrobiota bacterium]HNU52173.1 DcaP family trimeric outer membrane transporter [Verrucomicrobiota bacterium]
MKPNSPLKTFALIGAFLAAGTSGLAQVQSSGDLEQLRSAVQSMEQTIRELNRRIADLERQPKAAPPPVQPVGPEPAAPGAPQPTPPGADVTPKAPAPPSDLSDGTTQIPYHDTVKEEDLSAPRPGNAPLDPSYQGFMQLLGTKTWVKLGGYAKLDAIVDSTRMGNPNMFITARIPVEGEADYDKGEHFAMHAKQTRLNLELRSPTRLGALKIYYENDFFGNSTEPSMDYRLRHCYGQLANLTVGQTWTTFYDPDANPDTLDFEGPGVLPVLRQPELRYTLPIQKQAMYAAFAIEQPKSDLSNLPAGAEGRNTMPDFAGHWRWEGKPGHVQLGGVLRSLSYDNNAGPDDSALGWGVNCSGALKTFGADSLIASLSYGEGIGRYIQDLPTGSAGVVDASGDLHLLTAWGAMVGYRHQWSERWRSTLSYGYVQLDNRADQGAFAYDQTHYAQANLVWMPTRHFYVGLEYLYGVKEARNGNSGDDHRLQISMQYKLIR